MAKEKNSPYENRRSSSWRKIKNIKTQEVAIVGFTDPTNKDYFASLAIALPEKNNFRYLGKVGTGFNLALKKLLFEKITQLITENPTVVNPPKEKINWLKPTLVAEIKYREITKDGFVRQPVYLGLREDIEPHKIFLDLPADDPELTNLDKIYWPTEKITKGDMIEYYKKISKNLLPYIQNRPLSLNRYPSGIQKDHFYQKNFADVPSYVKTVSVSSQNRESTNYIICNNLETLKYITNLGSIEINPWLSQEPKLEYPDLIVIDLDPEAIDFSYVIKSAQTINEIFLRANIKAYLKTSGATGLHILIPIEPKYTFEQTQNIAHIIAQLANRRILGFTSLVRSPSKRQHKVYLDYLQNAKGQTIVAPYSLRPLPGAPVSTPLKWQELNDKLNPKDYNFFTIFNRLKNNGDIFQNITNNRQTLETILEKLEKI